MGFTRRSALLTIVAMTAASASADSAPESSRVTAAAVAKAGAENASAEDKPAADEPKVPRGRTWHHVRSPSSGEPLAIGTYQAGCVAGAARLAPKGDGYMVARPARRRHFGHPDLVDFVRTLGAGVAEHELGQIVIGDLGQPRGGPAPDGHSSHQSGLDVDIWYPLPESEAKTGATDARKRRALRPLPVANLPAKKLTAHWSPKVGRVLALAAADPRVDRIFVNPVIKHALCESEQDRAWLRKLRPWWGHDAHFHVRLSCPKGDSACKGQAPVPEGDGCEAVDWWFKPEARAERDQERAAYRARIGPGDQLPPACEALLAAED